VFRWWWLRGVLQLEVSEVIQSNRLAEAALAASAIGFGVNLAYGQATLTLIGTENGPVTGTTLLRLSDDGQVATGVSPGVLNGRTWRWTPAGFLEDLAGGGGFAVVSGDGVAIASQSFDATFPNPPAYLATNATSRWLGGQSWQSLGGFDPCDSTLSWPRDINGDGSLIVGAAWLPNSCTTNAMLWRAGQAPRQLREYFLLGGSCVANAASDDGAVVVGFNNGNGVGGRTGVYWLNGAPASVINGNIQIGELFDVTPDGRNILGRGHPVTRNAFIWDRTANRFTDLGVLPTIPGGSGYTALASSPRLAGGSPLAADVPRSGVKRARCCELAAGRLSERLALTWRCCQLAGR
jgi:uncharacterized membrane protein